ncbi:hypothetical protein D3C86_2039940 [compost metagenome]
MDRSALGHPVKRQVGRFVGQVLQASFDVVLAITAPIALADDFAGVQQCASRRVKGLGGHQSIPSCCIAKAFETDRGQVPDRYFR